MTQAIQTYLEDFAKTSIEFQKKYDVSKIENCINFIMKQAKEFLKSKNGYIEDNIVFKWARDYFNDDIFAQEQAEQEKLKKEQEQRKIEQEEKLKQQQELKKQEEIKKAKNEMFNDPNSLFFGLDEEPAGVKTTEPKEKEVKQEIKEQVKQTQTTIKIADLFSSDIDDEQENLFLEEEPFENEDVIFDDEQGEEENEPLYIF